MLTKSSNMLDRVAEYTKQPDGSWHADLYRPIRVHAEGRSTGDCKWKILEGFDDALADWLERIQELPSARLTGDEESATPVEDSQNS